jgi:hypothetical protein
VLNRAEVQVLDDPQHRVAGEAALVLGHAEQRLAVTVRARDRERTERHGG